MAFQTARARWGAFLAFSILLTLAALGVASTPPSHDVTIPTVAGQSVTVEWTGTSQPGSNPNNTCEVPPTEDRHLINLTAPDGAYESVIVTASFQFEWSEGSSDMILSLFKDGALVGDSDGGAPREKVVVLNPPTGAYELAACPFAASMPTPIRGKLVLTAVSVDTDLAPPAGTGNASGLAPRFQNYAPDYPNQGFGMFGGEATLDVNPLTGSVFYLGFLETMKLRLDDSTSPATQTWEIASTVASNKFTSDPILITDRDTGRIFTMQLLLGPGTSAMDYSDDDGATWTPGMAGAVLRSGADHQTLGVGKYPESSPIPHPTYDNAVYYCSQDVAVVYCSRSDDGGVTFNPAVTAYTVADCQGLHGHIKVAPDGTVYFPVSGCPSALVDNQAMLPALVVSEDAGLTWTIRPVTIAPPQSGAHGADPSVGIATDGTVYLAYADALTGHMHMALTRDKGLTWLNDVDLGALAGISAAEFPATVAGDPDRAAVAFFGSTLPVDGVDTTTNYPGLWHLYIAATYDGGQTYHVVNATPGDPIQKGGVCGGGFCRNLLDFFDAVIDTEGRILVGYEDGCIGGCPLGSPGTFSDQTVIARQSGGPRMLAAFDPAEPAVPAAPRLAGYRRPNFVYLEWPEADSGGAQITEYRVYRGDASGAETLLRSTGTTRRFVDTEPGAESGTAYYRVTAVNARGESAPSNELALAAGDNAVPVADACVLPGLLAATDRTGEAEAAPLPRDIAQVFVAEPEDMPGMLVFTVKFAEAAPPNQGGGPTVRIAFYLPEGGPFIRLQASGAGPTGIYGHLAPDPATGVHHVFTQDGTLDAATWGADGTLRMVIAKEKLGLETGDTLLGMHFISLTPGVSTNILTEEAGYLDYTLVGNDFCANGGVVAPPDVGLPPVEPPVEPPPVEPPAPAPVVDNNRFGGALGLGLLPLLTVALRRRIGTVA